MMRTARGGVVRSQAAERGGIRTVAAWALLCTAVIVAVGMLPPAGEWMARDDAGRTESVRVRGGDTLWSIAESHSEGRGVARTVELIRSLNGMSSSRLVAGDIIRVPAPEPTGVAYALAR